MSRVNECSIVSYVGNVESGVTKKDNYFVRISLPLSNSYKNDEDKWVELPAKWIYVTFWNKNLELAQKLVKGDLIYLKSTISTQPFKWSEVIQDSKNDPQIVEKQSEVLMLKPVSLRVLTWKDTEERRKLKEEQEQKQE